MESNKTPTIFQIIKTDFIALLCVIMPLISIGLMAYAKIADKPEGEIASTFILGILAICVPLLIWRVTLIQSIFINAIRVPGVVTKTSFFKDRAWISFSYEVEEKAYKKSFMVHQNKKTKLLQKDLEIDVLVHRANPKRATIEHIY